MKEVKMLVFFFVTFKLFLVLKLGASFNVIFVDGTTI